MLIGERLRELRTAKKLSQGDMERRTGLLRCYTSRVENGHTIPSVETLEKYARALEVPLYKLFYGGDEPPKKPKLSSTERSEAMWGASGNERRELGQFAKVCRGWTTVSGIFCSQPLIRWRAAIEADASC